MVHGHVVLFVVGESVGWVRVTRLRVVHMLTASLFGTLWIALATVLTTIPPVLYCIVASPLEPTGNLCPSLAHFCDHLLDQLPLFGSDWIMVQRWLEILMVALTTLLW